MATGAMDAPFQFVLAPAEALPATDCSPEAIDAAQRLGLQKGSALRLFSLSGQRPWDLQDLPLDGSLTGESRRSADGCQRICDAVIPQIDPDQLWLGVYRSTGPGDARVLCVDRFPLSRARNETCWFYPTHDGTFLSWTRALTLVLSPGTIADGRSDLLHAPYDRDQIRLLWSLLADDDHLTCVGLTYGGQRIDWAVLEASPEPQAVWSRFVVDSSAEVSLVVQDSRTVSPPD
jgi:hypothetical protein